jgi:hypothetical protein
VTAERPVLSTTFFFDSITIYATSTGFEWPINARFNELHISTPYDLKFISCGHASDIKTTSNKNKLPLSEELDSSARAQITGFRLIYRGF